MNIAFSIGSKCAVMLPRKFINPQITPAQGLIINRLLGDKALILIEEVWQFKGLSQAPLIEMCFSTGALKQSNWGWREIPEMLDKDEYLVVPASESNLMLPSMIILEKMIKKSIIDFKDINGFI